MPMQMGEEVGLILEDPSNPTLFILIKQIAELQQALKESDYDVIERCVVGVMSTRENTLYDALEVDRVWSIPGYGPLLYYIAMTEAGSKGLMSTRVKNQVSGAAKNVWSNFLYGASKDKVRAIPLNSETQHHSEDYLMKKYVLLQPLNLQPYLKRANKIIGRDPHREKTIIIEEVAEGLLGREINKIYGGDY